VGGFSFFRKALALSISVLRGGSEWLVDHPTFLGLSGTAPGGMQGGPDKISMRNFQGLMEGCRTFPPVRPHVDTLYICSSCNFNSCRFPPPVKNLNALPELIAENIRRERLLFPAALFPANQHRAFSNTKATANPDFTRCSLLD